MQLTLAGAGDGLQFFGSEDGGTTWVALRGSPWTGQAQPVVRRLATGYTGWGTISGRTSGVITGNGIANFKVKGWYGRHQRDGTRQRLHLQLAAAIAA